MNKKNNSFISNGASLITGQILTAILSICNVVVTSRSLDVDGRGYLALALLFSTLLSTSTEFGLGNAGTRLIAGGDWNKEEILASHTFIITVRTIVVTIIGCLIIINGSEFFFPGVPIEYLYLAIIQVPSLAIAGSLLPLLLGLGMAKTYNKILVYNSAMGVMGLLMCWVIVGLNVKLALIVNITVSIFISILTWKHIKAAIGKSTKVNSSYLKTAHKFGIGLYASNLLSFSSSKISWLIINGAMGPVGVGLYSIGQAVTERIYLVADSLATLLYPKISENPTSNSLGITPILFRTTLLISTSVSLIVGIISEWLVETILQKSFIQAVPIIKILLVSVVFSSGWRILSQDLNGRGNSGVTASVNAVTTIITLTLTYMFVSKAGAEGAAWSLFAGSFISFITGIFLYGYYHEDKMSAAASLFKLSEKERKFLNINK